MEVVLVSSDLMLSASAAGIAGRHGWTITAAGSADQAAQFAGSRSPALIAIDLRLAGLDIGAAVKQIRQASTAVRVVAFGPHVHEQSLTAAAAAGCDDVFTRGQFEQRMNALLAELKTPAG